MWTWLKSSRLEITSHHIPPAKEPFTEPALFLYISARSVWKELNSFISAISQVSDRSPTDAIMSPWERWEIKSVCPCGSSGFQGAKSTLNHTHTDTDLWRPPQQDPHTTFSTSHHDEPDTSEWPFITVITCLMRVLDSCQTSSSNPIKKKSSFSV